jgi:twitching motility protein PilT
MIDEAKFILSGFAKQIPPIVFGPDKVNFIIENMDRLTSDQKLTLHNLANYILTVMVDRDASDIEVGGHGTAGFIWFRIFGNKERVKDLPQLTTEEASVLVASLLNKNQSKNLLENRNVDFSYSIYVERDKSNVRFRADCYYDLDSLALNMRAIKPAIRPLESLEFHQNAIKVMNHNYMKFGLSLITGITGSGKSSTLDSIIDFHNKFDPAHLVIIASPVEYVHKSGLCLIRHREVGKDVPTFKDGVIQCLRQDPDIIVIGEMRDPDTILAALEVTDT